MEIFIFTEYKRNGITYRAHPNYNSFGEWYDWAMVKFKPARGQKDFPFNLKGGYYTINFSMQNYLFFAIRRKSTNPSSTTMLQC